MTGNNRRKQKIRKTENNSKCKKNTIRKITKNDKKTDHNKNKAEN